MVAILLNDQAKSSDLLAVMRALQVGGVHAKLLYSQTGKVVANDGSALTIVGTFAGSPPLTVDAVVVPCGNLADIIKNGDTRYYPLGTYKHLKPIALAGDARRFKTALDIKNEGKEGVVEMDNADVQFMDTLLTLMTAHRIWSRVGRIETTPA